MKPGRVQEADYPDVQRQAAAAAGAKGYVRVESLREWINVYQRGGFNIVYLFEGPWINTDWIVRMCA